MWAVFGLRVSLALLEVVLARSFEVEDVALLASLEACYPLVDAKSDTDFCYAGKPL